MSVSWQVNVSLYMPLMQPHYLTIDSAIFWTGEAVDGGDVRHGLYPILRIKPSHVLLKLFYWSTRPPNSPEVDVSRSNRSQRV